MSDTEKKTMEQCAREHRASMVEAVRLFGLLQDANDSDDLANEDWDAVLAEFDSIDSPECENCGKTWGDHDREHEGITDYRDCPDDEDGDAAETEFFIRDMSDLADKAREHIDSWNYGAGISMTVDVTLYGGGPAGGVEFDVEKGRYGLEMLGARVWHQDWFEPKGYAPLDDDTASRLFNLWGLEYMMEGQ